MPPDNEMRRGHAEGIACPCNTPWGSVLPPPPCPYHPAAGPMPLGTLQDLIGVLREPQPQQPHVDVVSPVAARDVVIAQQDRHLERYHRHLAAVYRVARLACLLIGGGLLFGVARDVAQGVDPWMPTLRLAGASWCLVTWRWTRSDEQAWRAGR